MSVFTHKVYVMFQVTAINTDHKRSKSTKTLHNKKGPVIGALKNNFVFV